MSRAFAALVALTLAGTGCSGLTTRYQAPGYVAQAPDAIVHVALRAWAPADAPGLAQVLAQVASDLVKLRKNYLVLDARAACGVSADGDGCAQGHEGVMFFRVLDAQMSAQSKATLHGALELYRCKDGALVFRDEATLTTATTDKSLADLTASYRTQLGDAGARWAAPAFALVQTLAEALPDPKLSEADIEEKIELGDARLIPRLPAF